MIVFAELQSASKPSVFVMRNGTNVACLVKDFYPKDVNISLQPPNQITNLDPAIVVSPSGKYSAIKLGQYKDSNPVTCSVQHNNEIVHSTEFELNTNSSGKHLQGAGNWEGSKPGGKRIYRCKLQTEHSQCDIRLEIRFIPSYNLSLMRRKFSENLTIGQGKAHLICSYLSLLLTNQ